jgi:thiol:disulfide interchange protein
MIQRLFLIIALLIAPHAYAESSVQNENTRATLLASHDAAKPGSDITLGVMLSPRPGWHFYWENPGDAGIPTSLSWTLPEGASAGAIQWPQPAIIREDTLVVFGYDSDTLMPVNISVPADFPGEIFPVKVEATWLICHDICIPESAELTLDLPVSNNPAESADYKFFEAAKASQPEKIETPLTYRANGDSFEFDIPASIALGDDTYFFPYEQNQLLYADTQLLKDRVLSVKRNAGEKPANSLTGYLRSSGKTYDIRAKLSDAAPVSDKAPESGTHFLLLILFAILGGLILNLMPCVLPVLSLKAIAIVKKSAHDRKVVVSQSLAYTFGVLVSFGLIAALLISLQHAGEQIGWGFQMQSPPFVGFLTILLFLVGLNLVGMFELPVLFGSALSDTRQHGLRGSFMTGVLATAVATPCTAPFMATAVGATLALPPAMSLVIFLSIGLGLASPFLLIAVFPRMVAYLPRPGAWMITFKELMAFPMFASVIWLLWVLTQQSGPHGLLVILVTMLAITFIIWLKGRCKDVSLFCRGAILLLLLAALTNGLVALSSMAPEEKPGSFSESALSELRANGTPVFIDATAAWCLTCQVNKHNAIDTEATRAAFKETGTVLMIADWTNRNPEITAFLKKFGYNGVPLYVYFPPSGEPVVLPQLLTESLVIATVKGQTP